MIKSQIVALWVAFCIIFFTMMITIVFQRKITDEKLKDVNRQIDELENLNEEFESENQQKL